VLYLADHLNSPVAITGVDGSTTHETPRHPYGAPRGGQRNVGDPWDYAGNEADRGSGLSDFNARPYRPEIGRFYASEPLVTDPAEMPAVSPVYHVAYAYSNGDPINGMDASGEWTIAIGNRGEAISILGGSTSAGIYIEFDLWQGGLDNLRFDPHFDIGTYADVSGAVGVAETASYGVEVTGSLGTASDIWDAPNIGVGGDIGVIADVSAGVALGGSNYPPVTVGVGVGVGGGVALSTSVAGGSLSAIDNSSGRSFNRPVERRAIAMDAGTGRRPAPPSPAPAPASLLPNPKHASQERADVCDPSNSSCG